MVFLFPSLIQTAKHSNKAVSIYLKIVIIIGVCILQKNKKKIGNMIDKKNAGGIKNRYVIVHNTK